MVHICAVKFFEHHKLPLQSYPKFEQEAWKEMNRHSPADTAPVITFNVIACAGMVPVQLVLFQRLYMIVFRQTWILFEKNLCWVV